MTFRSGMGESKLGSQLPNSRADEVLGGGDRVWSLQKASAEQAVKGGGQGEEWRQLGREAKEDAGCDR